MDTEAIINLIRFILSLGLLFAVGACGYTNGQAVIGSTSFLKEANRRAILTRDRDFEGEPMDRYTRVEKNALQRELDKRRDY